MTNVEVRIGILRNFCGPEGVLLLNKSKAMTIALFLLYLRPDIFCKILYFSKPLIHEETRI